MFLILISLLYCEQLSSIPGLEDVTVDGLGQRQQNGLTAAPQSQPPGPTPGAPSTAAVRIKAWT